MADVRTLDVEFQGNYALVGGNMPVRERQRALLSCRTGGMFVSIAGNWSAADETVCRFDPLDVEPCRLFHLIKMTFLRNTATFGAGGLFVTEPELVTVGCDVTNSGLEEWLPLSEARTEGAPSTDCFLFEGNAVLVTLLCTKRTRCVCSKESGGLYGPNVASRVDALFIVDPPSGKIADHRGGDRLLPPCKNATDCRQDREGGIKIEVRDAFNQTITGGIPDAGEIGRTRHRSMSESLGCCFRQVLWCWPCLRTSSGSRRIARGTGPSTSTRREASACTANPSSSSVTGGSTESRCT